MSIINNIPEATITEHVNWHMNPGEPWNGGRTITPMNPGSGEEFLIWHKGFIDRFHGWVQGLPANKRPDASSIAKWTVIPNALKMSMVGWNPQRAQQEVQLQDMDNFSSLDDLGMFLEFGLHGWFHGASSSVFQEPILGSYESPRSTYFWQLHGLIDHWRQQYADHNSSIVDRFRHMRPELLDMFPRVMWRRPRPRSPFPIPPRPEPWPPIPPWGPEMRPLQVEPRQMREVSEREMRMISALRETDIAGAAS